MSRLGYFETIGDSICRAHYFVTAWVPRLLPTTEEEWKRLKRTLVRYYGVSDLAGTWATIAGHVTSTPSHKRRRSYQYLANVAGRLAVNAAAQEIRKQAVEELQAKLKMVAEKLAEEEKESEELAHAPTRSDGKAVEAHA